METSTARAVPPYATPKAFYASLTHLKRSGIPAKVDSMAVGLGDRGGTWSHVQATFRSLGLVDRASKPTEALSKLVDAVDGPAWPAALRDWALPSYQHWLSGLRPDELAPKTLEERFRLAGCTAPATLEKAIRFCHAIHGDAGVPLPRDLSANGIVRSTPRPRGSGTRPRDQGHGSALAANHQEYPFQLRQDLVIRIALPRDITLAEVKRFAKFLETIPLPK